VDYVQLDVGMPDLDAQEYEFTGQARGRNGRCIRGWRMAGKLDGLKGNTIWEFKTCAGGTLDKAAAIYSNDLQTHWYAHCTRLRGGADYLIVEKPSIRMRKNETPKEYWQRCKEWYADGADHYIEAHVPYSQTVQHEIGEMLTETIESIRRNLRSGYWPRRYGYGCQRFGRGCQYQPICWYCDDSQFAKAESAHPELAGVK
jgi:hypothetical protein